MDRSVNILGFFLVLTVSMNSTVVQCQNVTSTTQASNKATSDSLLFNVSAHGIGLLGRTLHKAANRQYSSGVLYTGSYSAPAPAASLTVNTYSPPSYGFSPPSSGQLVQTSDTYGSGSAALTGAPVAVSGGGATSYGGSFSSSYSTQLGGPSALLNTLYSSGYNSASAPIQQSNSGGNFYSSSSQSGNLQSVSSSYGSPSAPLVAAPSYGTPTAPLVQAPSYSSPSSSIIQTSVSYGTPSAPLVAAAPSYGSPSAPLVSAPSYGSPSSAIVQAATYGTPSAPLVQAPSSYGTPSAQLTQSSSSYSSGTSYGSPSAPLVQAPAPAPICAKGQYTVDVPDNTPTGVIVLRVVAIDSQNSPLRYEILDWTGLVSGKIIVNSQTGDLIVAASLQRNAARWLDFNVQVTNAQSQTCSSAVRLNFITTATPAPTATYVGGSSYGGSPSASIVQVPSSYGTPSAPLVQAPSSYGTPSAPLIQSPPSYAPPSAPLIQSPSYGSPPAAPLIQSPSSYGSPSSPLVQAPSSYPTPSAPLIQAPSYGAPSAPLIQAPSYGAPSAPLIQSPSSYGTPSAPLVQAPTPSYGTPSAPLIQSPSYGSPSASLTSSSSYFSPGSSSLVFASSGSTYGGGGGNSNLVATPAPSTTYSYASPSYGGSNGNLVAQPTPPPPVYFPGDNGYSGGTQNLVATPAPAVNYGPSYGNSNQNLIATPAPAANYAVSYGNANQNLIATPAPVPNYGGNQNLIATSAPSSYSAGSPAAPLTATNAPFVAIQNQLQAGTYGGVGSGNIQTGGGGYGIGGNIVQQVTQAPLYTATYPSYGGGGGSYGGNGGGTTQPQLSPSGVISGGAGVNFNPFGSGSTANNNVNFVDLFNPVVTSQQLIATPQPFNPVVSAQNLLPTTASGQAIIRTPTSGSTGSDSVPPTAATMNWSFFVPQFNGMTTVIGTLNGPSSNNVFTLSGNPFFTVDQAGSVSLISGYCPPRSPMQESVGVRAVSADGSAVVQGSLSVVVFVAPSYLRICNSQPIPTTMPSTVKQLTIPPPTTASTAGNGGQNGVAVTFIGDSSFTTTKCDGQSAGAPTQVAATIRARFTPNIDFSKLRITVSNSLFKPALPVVCDETFICDISIVFAQPLDSSFAGNYAPYIQLEGGGLSKTVQNLQVHVNCNDLMADAVPLPPRRGVVDPSKIVPELPPCGVANVSVDVSEDMPVGTVVTSLPLNNGNPGFRYQILDSSAVGFFDLIEPASVAVSSPLFQPTVDSVYLRVVGMLGNATVCATDVFIGVKNVNRNRPVFDQSSYNFAIDCLLPMSIVGTVSASDIDAGRNNIRRFFVAPEDTPLVLVDPASGGIHLRQTLTDSTSFTIFVEDPGTNMRSSAVVQISCTGNNQVSGMLGAGSSGLGRSFQTTTTKAPVVLKSDPRKHPVVTSNKPSSFPFAVVFSGSSKASTSTSRSARSPPLT